MDTQVSNIVANITAEGKELFVTSRFVAEKFEKNHKDVLKAIENVECSEEFSRRSFAPSQYTNERGRTYKEYKLTRDGFMFLCMGFTGKEAARLKESFIEAFNTMETMLLDRSKNESLEWKQARLQIKQVRRSFTDVVKTFVEYAKSQGSKSADTYYANLTKMEYAALELVEKGSKIPDKFRDTLDTLQFAYLGTAEVQCRQALAEGMRQGMHYKEIYAYAKMVVNQFANSLKLPPAPSNLLQK